MRNLCLIAIAGALLAGCGQKGPLILPDRRAHPAVGAPASAAPASAAPASAASEGDAQAGGPQSP